MERNNDQQINLRNAIQTSNDCRLRFGFKQNGTPSNSVCPLSVPEFVPCSVGGFGAERDGVGSLYDVRISS